MRYTEVYRTWINCIKNNFKFQKDLSLSGEIYLSEADELVFCFKQCFPYGIGSLTKLGRQLTLTWMVQEILIDSTFKTN